RCGQPRAARPGRRARGRDAEVGRLVESGTQPAARIVANTGSGDETEQEIVLRPAEPTGLYVAGDMPAIAEERPVDEMAVIDPVRHEYGGKVDMPPGLRPIGGGGQDRREYLGRIELRGGSRGDPRPDAGDT